MPPKNNREKTAETKARAAKRVQSAADKTFGLKNKNKSKKVQEYVRQVQAQTSSDATSKRAEVDKARRLQEKKAAEAARMEAQALLGAVVQQKVPFGVDPKTVLCEAFKAGHCPKGNKCKFSHDLEVARKTAKRDLYTDDRKAAKEADTMDKWDESKLRQVIMSKHGNPRTTTDIVCKYFIDAVENSKYGWFWVCPNGDTCKYRHSLPEGFVLKTKEQKLAEKRAAANEPQITLEEFIETERAKLPKELTPVTLETFSAWKIKQEEKKKKLREEEELKKTKAKVISGKQLLLSGKYIEDEDTSEAWNMEELRQRVEDEPTEEIRNQDYEYDNDSTIPAKNNDNSNSNDQ
ncbi:uncharacterized protein SAPINGB_P005130 [Magnusiomyces paraingens]|uniref:C3H1-type domain-containing protein n=1 Tax=Magnusiomyces paraingens TaxID=2606893 RepID=A0A5E8BYK5_9ASCO|nr:uncharacterized protein SAPINGB_P005130 [Saprochaete ingens]VVT56523.1 unnamed protein product [Saprochaete ingens]